MDKNNEKKLTIIIIVLIVIIVGLGTFIAVNKFLLEDNSKNKTENPSSTNKPIPSESPKPTQSEDIQKTEEEEFEISMELATTIYNKFYDAEDCGTRFSKYYKYDEVTADDLTNEDKTYIISLNIAKRMDEHIFTEEEILKTKNQLLGENTTFEITNSKECKNFFKLNDGTYDLNRYCSGGMCTLDEITNIKKATKKGNTIIIDQNVIFKNDQNHNSSTGLTSYYYQDENQTILLEKRDYIDFDQYLEQYNKIDWEKYKNQVSVYRYTYQDNGDGTYMFIQMKKIK